MTDGIYQWCVETIRDAEYCADVKEVVAQVAATRVFSHVRNNVKFFLLLPDVVYVGMVEKGPAVLFAAKPAYRASVLLDDEKKRIAVVLESPSHTVALVYEREGKPVLKKTMFVNRQIVPT